MILSFDIFDKKNLELFGYKLHISQKFLLSSGDEKHEIFFGRLPWKKSWFLINQK